MERPDPNKPCFNMFPQAKKDVEELRCPTCGNAIHYNQFRDELSRREFGISGMCQSCQDDIWK